MGPKYYRQIMKQGFHEEGRNDWRDRWDSVRSTAIQFIRESIVVDVDPIQELLVRLSPLCTNRLFPPWNRFYFECDNMLTEAGTRQPLILCVAYNRIPAGVHLKVEHEYGLCHSSDWFVTVSDILIPGWGFPGFSLRYDSTFFVRANGDLVIHKDAPTTNPSPVVITRIGDGFKEYLEDTSNDLTELKWNSSIHRTLRICFNFISFMQCRNIKARKKHYHDFKPRKRQKHKVYKYYELVVTKPSIQAMSQEHGEGVKGKALHSVRGNVAHYAEDKPLFGRSGLHGDFFRPQHVRGNLEYGKIVKTYGANTRYKGEDTCKPS